MPIKKLISVAVIVVLIFFQFEVYADKKVLIVSFYPTGNFNVAKSLINESSVGNEHHIAWSKLVDNLKEKKIDVHFISTSDFNSSYTNFKKLKSLYEKFDLLIFF